jgi:hypothetical protein
MWFGDFGEITLFDGFAYQGNNDLDEFRNNYDSETKYIGFRTWGNGYYNIDFENLEVSNGVNVSIKKGSIISSNQVLLEFENSETEKDLILDGITDYKLSYDGDDLITSQSGNNIINYMPFEKNSVILTLEDDILGGNITLDVKRGFVEQQYVGDVFITNGIGYEITETTDIIALNENFGKPNLNSWSKYGKGKLKLSNDKTYVKKEKNNDPDGGYIELDNYIDTDTESFVVSVEMEGPSPYNFNGDSQDRFSIGNSDCDGVGMAIRNNADSFNWWNPAINSEDMRIEKRNNGGANSLTGWTDAGPLSRDGSYVASLIYNHEDNTLTAKIDDKITIYPNARQEMPKTLTHFYIHGGYDYYIHSINIIKKGDSI